MKKHICLFILIISAFNLSAQVSTVSLNFNSLVNNKDTLELEKRYYFKSIQDSLQVDVLKFYITDIKFIKDETILASVHKKHFLINFEDILSKRIKTQISDTLKFNKIRFNIGIDSITNVSGVCGQDLDPTNGMYWTWNSGYINCKLEGSSNKFKTRKNRYTFHLGGYMSPFISMQTITLEVTQNKEIEILINIDDFFSNLDVTKYHTILSPNRKAIVVSKHFSTVFYVEE